jgi:CheY-like chemotaxis protein
LKAFEPSKRRVLVVDEDAAVLKQTKKTLEEGGLEVHTLDNPLLVAQTIRRFDIDLVLLETELSTMKGAVVIASLRNHGLSRVPVMLHSRLEAAALEARAKEVGAPGFIRKGSPSLLREVDGFLSGSVRK